MTKLKLLMRRRMMVVLVQAKKTAIVVLKDLIALQSQIPTRERAINSYFQEAATL